MNDALDSQGISKIPEESVSEGIEYRWGRAEAEGETRVEEVGACPYETKKRPFVWSNWA